MNFVDIYRKSAKVKRMINLEPDPEYLIPNIYDYSNLLFDSFAEDFLHLLAGGTVHVEFPFAVSYQSMDCFLCIYTDRGGASIQQKGQTISLTKKQIAFLDCKEYFSLQSFLLPWDFKLFFFTGKEMELYRPLLFSGNLSSFQIPEYSSISRALCTLLSLNTMPELYDLMEMQRNLTDILCSLSSSVLEPSHSTDKSVPEYILEMQDYLEHHFSSDFSLGEWEDRFHINKYRLCREFSAAFQLPPLKYLTKKRIEESQKMLLTTDWTVHEISSKVGYDNVNHFINLFKKNTGLTPGAFRQTVLAVPPVLRSPVQ
ncbi:MAG: helix-turn-helix transcriptional regulator [Bariatricus sp.]